MTEAELQQTEAKKPRKARVVEKRHPLHQAMLDAMHEFAKKPWADQGKAVTDAMTAYKNYIIEQMQK